MNKYIICILSACFMQETKAQISQGTYITGMNLKDNHNVSAEKTIWGIWLNPYYGYFVKKDFCIGVGVVYSYSQQTYTVVPPFSAFFPVPKNTTRANGFGAMQFARRYFFIGPDFAFHLQSELAIECNALASSTPGYTFFSETKRNTRFNSGFRASLFAGISWFISKNLALQAQGELASYHHSPGGQYQTVLNPNLLLGVSYFWTE